MNWAYWQLSGQKEGAFKPTLKETGLALLDEAFGILEADQKNVKALAKRTFTEDFGPLEGIGGEGGGGIFFGCVCGGRGISF